MALRKSRRQTSRMVEIASMVEPEEHNSEEYRHYTDCVTVVDGYCIEGRWHHVTGVPIDKIFGFTPKMWRDKDVRSLAVGVDRDKAGPVVAHVVQLPRLVQPPSTVARSFSL